MPAAKSKPDFQPVFDELKKLVEKGAVPLETMPLKSMDWPTNGEAGSKMKLTPAGASPHAEISTTSMNMSLPAG